MGGWWWIKFVIAPIVAGLVAASGFIAKKAPDAQGAINKLLPYKAFIGVAVLVIGVWTLIDIVPHIGGVFKTFMGFVLFVVVVCEVLLGLLLGMPQIVKWIPGDSAPEQKALELSKKLVPYEVMIGFIAIAGGIIIAIKSL